MPTYVAETASLQKATSVVRALKPASASWVEKVNLFVFLIRSWQAYTCFLKPHLVLRWAMSVHICCNHPPLTGPLSKCPQGERDQSHNRTLLECASTGPSSGLHSSSMLDAMFYKRSNEKKGPKGLPNAPYLSAQPQAPLRLAQLLHARRNEP